MSDTVLELCVWTVANCPFALTETNQSIYKLYIRHHIVTMLPIMTHAMPVPPRGSWAYTGDVQQGLHTHNEYAEALTFEAWQHSAHIVGHFECFTVFRAAVHTSLTAPVQTTRKAEAP
jgi:hypothetical protein